ncbi:phosphatases II [Meredithblackwellia eburnea MCA 4105]
MFQRIIDSASRGAGSGATPTASTQPDSLPPFLALPLSSAQVFQDTVVTLTKREQDRVALAARSHPPPQARQRLTSHAIPNGSAHFVPYISEFAIVAATTKENSRKNRYPDVVAYDRTRLLLPPLGGAKHETGGEGGEYVNATLIPGPLFGVKNEAKRWWVASQGPTPQTVHAFLSLLLHPPSSTQHISEDGIQLESISLIVQVTPLVEQNREKCSPYFPSTVGEVWEIPSAVPGNLPVFVGLKKKEMGEGRRTSWITVGNEAGKEREIVHVEYLGWGDHGVPDSPSHMVNFIRQVLPLHSPVPSTPVLVHCSAGVGRTGTFMTIAQLLPLLPSLATSPPPSGRPPASQHLGPYTPSTELQKFATRDFVGETVDWWRDHRVMMVQTSAQLRWCYEALKVGWEEPEVTGPGSKA